MVSNAKTDAGMSCRPLQIVAVVVALITASSVCLGKCAADPYRDARSSAEQHAASIPPCHKQQPTEPTTQHEQCHGAFVFIGIRAYEVLKADLQPGGIALAVIDFSDFSVLPERKEYAVHRENPTPLQPELVFSTVLRL